MTIANLCSWTTGVYLFRRAILTGGAMLLIALSAMAQSDSAFSLQGFGTLGVARTTTDNVEFVRDLSQPRGIGKEWSGLVDSVLGLQGSWHLDPQWDVVVQATSRYRYDQTFYPEIA